MTVTELYSWLCSFINLEQGSALGPTGLGGKPSVQAEEHFKLDRILALSELAGRPELDIPVIHIAGSKGKGSVCAMTASILETIGIKTARYMSPHVNDWRERISRGDGSFFPDAVYSKAGRELQHICSQKHRYSGNPTFFELFTLLFFLCARLDKCKAMVVETGLGGRLDATNIVDPVVSVITIIEKEHTEYLGNTLTEIAGEKAGIIKKSRPVLSAKQQPEVLAVLKQKAEEQDSPFFYVPDCMEADNIQIHPAGMDFTCIDKRDNTNNFTVYRMHLSGKIYADNAILAILAARTAFPKKDMVLDNTAMAKALSMCSIPARFEKVCEDPLFIVDGAHTPLSAEHCCETFCTLYGNGGILLFGCAGDKDAQAMAKILLPFFKYCIITAPGTFKTSDPNAVYRIYSSEAKKNNNPACHRELYCIPHTAEAIKLAIKKGKEKSLPILGCGSFYLAAEIRKTLISNAFSCTISSCMI